MSEEAFTPRDGRTTLSHAWWEAMDELRSIMALQENPQDRMRAAEIILEYTSRLNVGLGEPFIPDEPEPDDDEDNDADD
jgi:hypothetical protein